MQVDGNDEGEMMPYTSERFVEHHQTRLPILQSLLELGWSRDQIQCPSEDSEDKEWRVPKTPSASAVREKGHSFDGFPVDIAIFDSEEGKGDWRHAKIIIECKAPGDNSGLAELETYMGLEPKVRLGVLTDGLRFTRVYKLPSGGFSVEESASLPSSDENLILKENISFKNMNIPTLDQLKCCFHDLLALVVSSDGRSTRPDDRLKQLCNLLLVKLQSDTDARAKSADCVDFQVSETPEKTAEHLNNLFKRYKADRRDLFSDDEPDEILFDSFTTHAVVAELQNKNLADVGPETLSLAFQVFRNANLKSGEGQYFTPSRVVESAAKMMCIDSTDKVIDPACGTGGFLSAAYLQVASQVSEADAVRWANAKLYGVDLDDINVKLARALMVGIGDGSTHVKLGDSIRQSKWKYDRHGIGDALADDSYDVVLTNPPFGKELVITPSEASSAQYSVCKHTKGGKAAGSYMSTEIGIVFVERAYRLLHDGGRLGIVLPETYFFSKSYEWFRAWLDGCFILKGVLNIPMEAFQGFCRAKTNFYVFEKKKNGDSAELPLDGHQPYWFQGGLTWVSNAPTIGINKDGGVLYRLDQATMSRTDEIDDAAATDVDKLLRDNGETSTAGFVETRPLSDSLLGVPKYCDRSSVRALENWAREELPMCHPLSLGVLVESGLVEARGGHGSPSLDFRIGDVPYIKVSDLRNGQVNPNSSNRVPLKVAERFWKGKESGLKPWDIVTPARASKNIGEPAVVLPGQEEAVFTKEVLVLRAAAESTFDNFYLAWALMLPKVQEQWKRVVLMQTNREDLGDRWKEIVLPIPESGEVAANLSASVKRYYSELSRIKQEFASDMKRWG